MTIKNFAPWNWGRKSGLGQEEGDHPFSSLQRQMNRLIEDFFGGEPLSNLGERLSAFSPRISVIENDSQIKVAVELPGIEEGQIDLHLTKDSLTIRGEKKHELKDHEVESIRYSERAYGTFQRIIPLSTEIDEDKVDAHFSRGVLTVSLPKVRTAQEVSRKISVRSE